MDLKGTIYYNILKAEKGGCLMKKMVELIDEEMIASRVCQMAEEITKDYEGKELTLISILKGSVYFFADLSRKIKLDTQTEFIRVSSYQGENSTEKIEFKVGLDELVTGKDVLVVEDIIDSGRTLSFVLDYLREQKPNSLKLCAFLDKPERRVVSDVNVDYVGFIIPNRFVIGYGMDLDEKYRNLPAVNCVIDSAEDEKQAEEDKKQLKLQVYGSEQNLNRKMTPELMNLKKLLSTDRRYYVPFYQRPYDWDERNITKLIETLNQLNNGEKEYVFLGNMEFREEDGFQQIIDGQQRITTLLILLNYLYSEAYSDEEIMKMLKIKVDSNEEVENEQRKFEDFLNDKEPFEQELAEIENYSNAKLKNDKIRNSRNNNVYGVNYYYLKRALEDANITTEKEKLAFAENILKNTYVVAINLKNEIQEHEAINIFDNLNTTGKPLGTNDIFKIKMYEYAKKNHKDEAEAVSSINELYNKIETTNSEIIEKEATIRKSEGAGKSEFSEINMISETFSKDDILRVYKFILIAKVVNQKKGKAKASYKSELFTMSNSNFYYNLFLKVLDNRSQKQFEGFDEISINIQEMQRIYEAYAKLADMILEVKQMDAETYFAYKMLRGYTRYSSAYDFLPVLFLWKFQKIDSEFNRFVIHMSKYFEYYSMVNRKVIYSVKTFVNDIIVKIVDENYSAIQINNLIEEELKHLEEEVLTSELEADVANVWWNKMIACLVIAKERERLKKPKTKDNKELLQRYQRLFTRKFDIEHIYATENNEDQFDRYR